MPEPSPISLIPIIITLSLSLYTRNVIIGLFSGVFVGVLMLNGLNPLTGLSTMVTNHIVPELTDSYNAGVLVLLAFIGGFVALVVCVTKLCLVFFFKQKTAYEISA